MMLVVVGVVGSRARRPIRDAAGRCTGGAPGVNGRDIVLSHIQ